MLMPLALLLVIIFLASFILTMVGLSHGGAGGGGGGLTFPPFCPVEIACHHCRVSIPFPQWLLPPFPQPLSTFDITKDYVTSEYGFNGYGCGIVPDGGSVRA